MPGDTGPPISRKIPGNKFNRAEFIRCSNLNLKFFAHIDQINKANKKRLWAHYVNVIIDKSIILVNSFCDNFSSPANLKENYTDNSNSNTDSNSNTYSTDFSQFSSIPNNNHSLTSTTKKSSFLFSTTQYINNSLLFLFRTAKFIKFLLLLFFHCLINFVKILLETLKNIIELFLHKFIANCKKCAKYLDYSVPLLCLCQR